MNELSYKNKRLSEFGTFYDSHQSFGTPERDVEYVEILGRNGDLIIDNDRYKNIEINIPCYINHNFLREYRRLMAFLMSTKGYNRLELTQEPNHFRMASFNGSINPSPNQFHRTGQFVLSFLCKPQRWLKSGERKVSIESSETIINPTLFASKPLIRCYGDGSLTINNQTITISPHSFDYIDIDCDIMEAFCGSSNANSYVSFDSDEVTLESGTNGITIDDLTKIEITPRWFEI